jgi:hypothetical protein
MMWFSPRLEHLVNFTSLQHVAYEVLAMDEDPQLDG